MSTATTATARRMVALAAVLAVAQPSTALAHNGPPPVPGTLWRSWNADAPLMLGLATGAWLYGAGVRAVRARRRGRMAVPWWRVAAFAGATGALFVALVSPLEALGSALFAGHMGQHLLLTVVAAPLLVLSAPGIPALSALPRRTRRAVARVRRRARRALRLLTFPVSAWLLHAAALSVWHLPALYEAALTSEPVHVLQHASFFGTALLLWSTVLHPLWSRRGNHGASILCLFGTALVTAWLGALLIFSPSPWYRSYASTAPA